MRVLVCGGRDFEDSALLDKTLKRLASANLIDCIIEGNARGADRMAGFWASKHLIDNLKFNAEWDRYGPGAGPRRNQRMLDEGKPDLVIAFAGGNGTADMVRRARAAGVEVIEITE